MDFFSNVYIIGTNCFYECFLWQLEGIISCERLSLILCKAVGTGEEGVIGDASTPLSL